MLQKWLHMSHSSLISYPWLLPFSISRIDRIWQKWCCAITRLWPEEVSVLLLLLSCSHEMPYKEAQASLLMDYKSCKERPWKVEDYFEEREAKPSPVCSSPCRCGTHYMNKSILDAPDPVSTPADCKHMRLPSWYFVCRISSK